MSTIKDVIKKMQSRSKVAVTITRNLEESLDKGTRCLIYSYKLCGDGIYEIEVDMTPFVKYNHAIYQPTYYYRYASVRNRPEANDWTSCLKFDETTLYPKNHKTVIYAEENDDIFEIMTKTNKPRHDATLEDKIKAQKMILYELEAEKLNRERAASIANGKAFICPSCNVYKLISDMEGGICSHCVYEKNKGEQKKRIKELNGKTGTLNIVFKDGSDEELSHVEFVCEGHTYDLSPKCEYDCGEYSTFISEN